ncbi:hypothetical protein OG884_28735 [Streptosporangium sp. NBC_01755]|uniref:hypothetical protein n=1 Tax=unclassified Streptosporangium TaxID=2632669 RepID=UPI002DD921C2|nr:MULTISPECIES: hypothetical protein [unclassified Streptosporangium]WSA23039.1 hypothetical protein OIE13_18850 [Streptosporangium sp. NBC_01810]WSC98817.1 hypothetical protein OG884_28735 [Streptosporangium sp. NBC_01755]
MRHVAGCVLLLLLVAGCTNSSPTLDEAAQVLAQDMKKLEPFYPTTNKKTVDRTGKGNDDFSNCSKSDTALRLYQISGDFGEDIQSTPAERADLFGRPLRDKIKEIGYEIDRNSSWAQPGRSVGILRKNDPGITLIVLVQASKPNIEIIGKTDCLSAPSPLERGLQ